MRILVIIIAILALLGGVAHLLGGVLGLFSGVLMLTTNFESVPEIAKASEMSPQTIGFIFLIIALLMTLNGLIFVIFAIGTFIRKSWARFLGIGGYALNIFVFVLTALTTTIQGSMIPYIVGSFVAIVFIVILLFAGKAFQKDTVIQS